MIAFSPLAQGMLTDKYLNGIPDNSRAAKSTGHLQREQVTEEKINKVKDILEWAFCIVIALVIALLFRYYIGTPTIVKQPSMYPTLKENQRLWLNRWGRTTKNVLAAGIK